jgi:uncharacterized integral membrane protein
MTTNPQRAPGPHAAEPEFPTGRPNEAPPPTIDHASETRTRTSTVWVAVVSLVASLVLVLVFVLQNLQSVAVSFLIFHGKLPLGIALLVAATLGGVVVVAAGAARVVQLRRVRRRNERSA